MAKQRNRQPQRTYRLEIGIAALILVGLIVLRIGASQAIQGSGCPSGAAVRAQVESLIHARLPLAVIEVDSLQTGERDQYCEVYTRFRLPAFALTEFLNSTRIRPPLASAPSLAEFASIYRRNPWKPEAGVSYICGRSPQALDYLQSVCVDTRQDGANIVYLTVNYLPD